GLAVAERRGLTHGIFGTDHHRQVAVRDRGRLQRDALVQDHRTVARIDDHARRRIHRCHIEALDTRDEIDALVRILRAVDPDGARVFGGRHLPAHRIVDGIDDTLRGAEVRTLQLQRERAAILAELQRHAALNDRTIADGAAGLLVDLHAGTAGARARATDQ